MSCRVADRRSFVDVFGVLDHWVNFHITLVVHTVPVGTAMALHLHGRAELVQGKRDADNAILNSMCARMHVSPV